MCRSMILLGWLCFAARAVAFPLWLDRPHHTNPVDPLYEGRPSGASGGTQGSQGLEVYVQEYAGNGVPNQPVSGAAVVLGSDVAHPVISGVNGRAAFSNVLLPIDVHIYSPLSGTTAVCYPSVASYFSVGVTSLAAAGFQSLTYSASSSSGLHYTFAQITPPASVVSSRNEAGDPPDFSFGGGSGGGGVTLGGASAYTGNNVNIDYIGWDSAGATVCAEFYPQFVMGSSDVTVTALAPTTGFLILNTQLSLANTWPSYNTFVYAGSSATNFYVVYDPFQTVSGTVPQALSFVAPGGASYFVFNVSANNYAAGVSHSAQLYDRVSGSLPATHTLPLTNQYQLISTPNSSNPTLSVQSPNNITGPVTWSFSLGAQWVGIKTASAGVDQTVTIPTGVPAGYPSSFIATPGLTTTVECNVWSPQGLAGISDQSGGLKKTITW
jgi:hypothetical protein